MGAGWFSGREGRARTRRVIAALCLIIGGATVGHASLPGGTATTKGTDMGATVGEILVVQYNPCSKKKNGC